MKIIDVIFNIKMYTCFAYYYHSSTIVKNSTHKSAKSTHESTYCNQIPGNKNFMLTHSFHIMWGDFYWPYTQRNILEILLNQTEIRLYLLFSDWFWTKRMSVCFQVNQTDESILSLSGLFYSLSPSNFWSSCCLMS